MLYMYLYICVCNNYAISCLLFSPHFSSSLHFALSICCFFHCLILIEKKYYSRSGTDIWRGALTQTGEFLGDASFPDNSLLLFLLWQIFACLHGLTQGKTAGLSSSCSYIRYVYPSEVTNYTDNDAECWKREALRYERFSCSPFCLPFTSFSIFFSILGYSYRLWIPPPLFPIYTNAHDNIRMEYSYYIFSKYAYVREKVWNGIDRDTLDAT